MNLSNKTSLPLTLVAQSVQDMYSINNRSCSDMPQININKADLDHR